MGVATNAVRQKMLRNLSSANCNNSHSRWNAIYAATMQNGSNWLTRPMRAPHECIYSYSFFSVLLKSSDLCLYYDSEAQFCSMNSTLISAVKRVFLWSLQQYSSTSEPEMPLFAWRKRISWYCASFVHLNILYLPECSSSNVLTVLPSTSYRKG